MQYGGNESGGVQWVAPGPTPNAPPGAGNQNSQKPPVAAPAPSLKSQIPNSASYLHAQSVADDALRAAKIRIGTQRQQAAGQYGYLIDAKGNLTGVDPNNPYGHYQQERSNEAAATLQGLAAQRAGGWGGGGMVANALSRARLGINKGMYDLNTGWQNTLNSYTDQLAGAQQGRDTAVNDAWQSAWQQGIDSGNYDPVTGEPIPGDQTPIGAQPGGSPAPYTAGEMGGGFKAAPTNHSTPNIKAKPLSAKPKAKSKPKAGRRP